MAIDVSLKVSFLIESFSAELTLVQAHVRVGPQVVRQMRQLLEASSTFIALMRFFSGMCVAVDLHVDFLMKSFATVVADEWLVIGMRAHVRMQVGRAVERLVALQAHVWFDRGVRQPMACEVTWLSEGAAALLTDEGLVACVNPFVCYQSIGTAEGFTTHVASVTIFLVRRCSSAYILGLRRRLRILL